MIVQAFPGARNVCRCVSGQSEAATGQLGHRYLRAHALLQGFPINLRYPRELRDSVQDLPELPIGTLRGETLTLSSIASVQIVDGPPMIKSENARPDGWIYVDIRGRDLGGYVTDAKRAVAEQVQLPPGYSVAWSGQFEYLERAAKRMKIVVPFTLAVIFLLLYLTFRSAATAVLIMATLPFALVGGLWLIYVLGYHLSVASGVGFIALAGVAAEFGVIMLIYLDKAIREREQRGQMRTVADLREALIEGAVLRVRPKAMTVAVIIAGLLPLFIGTCTGSEVMQRIAAPMVGGMVTTPLLSMIVLPAAYLLLRGQRGWRALRHEQGTRSCYRWPRRSSMQESGRQRPPELLQIAAGNRLLTQPHLAPARAAGGVVKGAEQPIPDQEHLAEVDLRVLELAFVVETVHLRHAQQIPQQPQPVVEVGVLEGQMHAHEAHPGGDGDGCCAQGQQRRQAGCRKHQRRERMPPPSVEPVEALRAVVDGVQPPQQAAGVAGAVHGIEAQI